jgi:hypothetical protein
MGHPSANRLIRDGDPAFSEKVLDIPEAQCEAQAQPYGVLDDGWREPITAVAQCLHRQKLPAVRDHGHGSSLNVTNPCRPTAPDLNPIELVFSKFKRMLRSAAERTVGALWSAIGRLLQQFTPEECANYLRHYGYSHSGLLGSS